LEVQLRETTGAPLKTIIVGMGLAVKGKELVIAAGLRKIGERAELVIGEFTTRSTTLPSTVWLRRGEQGQGQGTKTPSREMMGSGENDR
jgi:hypothetical protein